MPPPIRPDSSAAEATEPDPAPPGFLPVPMGGGFIACNGPLYLRQRDGEVKLGFRVEPRHCNPMGMCHGGMLAGFCDMLLPVTAHRVASEVGPRFLATVSLQIDYLAPVPLGAWVEGEAQVLRVTRSMVFMQGLVRADGQPAARCSGVFKIGPRYPDDTA